MEEYTIEKLLEEFTAKFHKNMVIAKESGAVPDNTEEVILAKCILSITAEQCEPISPFGQKLLKNLRHFV